MQQLNLRINTEASKRFGLLHKKSGLKTKGQTLEALIFNATEMDKNEDSTSAKLNIIDTKLNTILEWISDPL